MPRVASTFILNIFIMFIFSKTNILFGINISTNFIVTLILSTNILFSRPYRRKKNQLTILFKFLIYF